MKRNERIEIILPGGEKLERKVGDVISYLGRMRSPVGTRVVHHRGTGGKTWFIRGDRGWAVEKVTYA